MDLTRQSASRLAELIAKKEVSPSEVNTAFIDNIRKRKDLNAFVKVFDETKDSSADNRLPGIAIKDNINIAGKPTTCCSRILEGFVSPYDAFVTGRLRTAGASFLGKTNMDEFAMGSSTETSAFGTTLNPWNTSCIPGGSSGGSAAAVAARLAPWALGSDTGGSIRQPAALCGVVGLKPTYGTVSRRGLVAFASSLDQIGTFTRTVEDAALLMDIIAGHDAGDSTSSVKPLPVLKDNLNLDLKNLRIGLPKEYFVDGMDPEVRDSVRNAAALLEKNGCRVEEVSLPHSRFAVEVYYIVAPAEASSNLSRFDGVRYGHRAKSDDLTGLYTHSRSEGFGAEVKRRILIGTYALSAGYYDAYYLKAQKVRTLIRRDFTEAFRKVDILLTPVSPTPAFRIGERSQDPLQMYLSDIFTISANLAGIPGLSVPCGLTKSGLPVGVQLLADHFREPLLLAAGHAYERLRGPFPDCP
jgi:aspartyl-tRNA(Asn)/glutamyl-tRNA(Gln) amidotransferase subunit A